MTHADLLQTIAEIGLGFAGFSALIAGMRRDGKSRDIENSSRGRAVVETSLSVLFGCMTPFFLVGVGVAETNAFRLSGGIFLLIGLPLSIRGFRRAMASRSANTPNRPALNALSTIAGLSGLVFSVACVLGLPIENVPTYYLGALLGILGISAVNFAGFVFAIDDDAPEIADNQDTRDSQDEQLESTQDV